MEPCPGMWISATRKPAQSVSHPSPANAGRTFMYLTMVLPTSAPVLPPAPTIPATPPTAEGSTKGTSPYVPPSVACKCEGGGVSASARSFRQR